MIAAGSETLALFRQSEDSSEVRLFYQPYIYIHYAGHKNLSGGRTSFLANLLNNKQLQASAISLVVKETGACE